MNKWLVGLIVIAIGLPLLMFIGNLKFEAPEAGKDGSDSGSKAVTAYPSAPELSGISAWINSEPLATCLRKPSADAEIIDFSPSAPGK